MEPPQESITGKKNKKGQECAVDNGITSINWDMFMHEKQAGITNLHHIHQLTDDVK